MAQKSILNFFVRKPTTPNLKGDNKNGSNVAVKKTGTPSTGQNGDSKIVEERSNEQGEIDDLAKSCLEDPDDLKEGEKDSAIQEEIDDLSKSCLEDLDDFEMAEVKEPIEVKKKRKRIQLLDSDSGSDEEYRPDSTVKDESDEEYIEDDIEDETPPKKKPKLNGFNRFRSTPKADNSAKDKENTTPNIKNKSFNSSKLAEKLSGFASPSLNRSEADLNDSTNLVNSNTSSFVHLTNQKYSFLWPENIMDKQRRKPDHENYDPSTLYVSESFLKDVSPGQRQWWELKSKHFDTILFFKMGKFYELYHMDAVLAVENCGVIYMKDAEGKAHAGFPEKGYQKYADVFVGLGFKVARIEQTETPEMNAERVKTMLRPTKFDKVVRREVCRITTSGTKLTDSTDSDLSYLVAFCGEKDLNDPQIINVGICFLDGSIGVVHMSEFQDDKELSSLETILAQYPPSEILHKKNKTLFENLLDKFSTVPRRTVVFPESNKSLKMIHDYYGGKTEWPQELLEYLDESDNLGLTAKKGSEMAISALGAIIFCLRDSLVDHFIMEQKKFKTFEPDLRTKLSIEEQTVPGGKFMILDNKTLKNLNVLSGDHPGGASLFSVTDKTSTPMGRRKLREWLSWPCLQVNEIIQRQNIVKYFEENPNVVQNLKDGLRGIPDLEKLLTTITVSGIKIPSNHPEERAIYYEDYSGKKVGYLCEALEGLEKLHVLFRDTLSSDKSIFAKYVTEKFPDISEVLHFFKHAFDHKSAKETGKIIPKKGVDEDYDQSKKDKLKLEEDLDDYLRDQKRVFGNSQIKYFATGNTNNMYQLEIPENLAKKIPESYTLSSSKKGFKRFTTEEILEFRERLKEVDEAESRALSEVNRKMFMKFSNYRTEYFDLAINLTSMADALLSLFIYSKNLGEESCFPELKTSGSSPMVRFVQGKHPIVIAANPNLAYIPNNFQLDESLAILTGANMGGKSTLMRQTALLTILAQIGAKVPAQEFQLSPVDRIFTRIGASDNIFEKESTFFVELAETRTILNYATKHSLVLIDELGRGTTTFDGCAIAYSVAKFLTQKQCRTLFSTHYHELMREFQTMKNMKVYHMTVQEDDEDVVFMYTVSSGPCSKSHGFNAAKMAGLPAEVISQGLKVAEKFEKEQDNLLKLATILCNTG